MTSCLRQQTYPWYQADGGGSGGRRGSSSGRKNEITLSGMNVIGRQQLVISTRTSNWSWITPQRKKEAKMKQDIFPQRVFGGEVAFRICGKPASPVLPGPPPFSLPSSHLLFRLLILRTEPLFLFLAGSVLEQMRRENGRG